MPTHRELLARLREDLDDTVEPVFWSDAQLVGYITEAIDQVCLRTRIIRDSDSASVCRISLEPGRATYPIDERVIQILRATITGAPRAMTRVGYDELDADRHDWEQLSAERPDRYIVDLSGCSIRVVPVPTVSNTLQLTVQRYVLTPMTLEARNLDARPELARAQHYPMLHWAKHLAYQRQDGDRFDSEAAERHAGEFAFIFGDLPDAHATELLRRRHDHEIRPHFV